MDETTGPRAELWLPLLRRLTEQTPYWAVWKNADSALLGTGDVDSVAARRAWPMIEREFHAWAQQRDLGPSFSCRHIPRTVNHFVLPSGGPDLLQLEVKAGATFRGSVQFHAVDVLALSQIDERGFRELRPGAEGLLKLVLNGMHRGGRPDWDGIADKHVLELLESDWEGAERMAARLGPGAGAVLRAANAARRGDWDRRAMLELEAWAAAKSVVQPHVIAERVWFRLVRKPRCPVLRTVYQHGRRVPDADPMAWLRTVGEGHHVRGAREG
jgi:hypothetical protein